MLTAPTVSLTADLVGTPYTYGMVYIENGNLMINTTFDHNDPSKRVSTFYIRYNSTCCQKYSP